MDTIGLLRVYLKVTLVGSSEDLATLARKRMDALTTGDANQKMKVIIAAAGASN